MKEDAVSQVCKPSHSEIYEYQKRELDLVLSENMKMMILQTMGYHVIYPLEISQRMRLCSKWKEPASGSSPSHHSHICCTNVVAVSQ